jgi:hypothetical protein
LAPRFLVDSRLFSCAKVHLIRKAPGKVTQPGTDSGLSRQDRQIVALFSFGSDPMVSHSPNSVRIGVRRGHKRRSTARSHREGRD